MLNIANLEKLASYLEKLPEDYNHFNMGLFLEPVNFDAVKYCKNNGGLAGCGTVACAVGHGPAAGILFRKEDFMDGDPCWTFYSQQFIADLVSPEWDWAFGGDWEDYDNHPWGAAARIRYLIANGSAPSGFCTAAECWVEHYQEFFLEKTDD